MKVIKDTKGEGTFIHQGHSDYELSEALKALFDIKLSSLEDFVFVESDLFNALAYFIRNYKANQNPDCFQQNLSKYDIKCLT